MTATATKAQDKALDTCDGVIEIAKSEMLTHGFYVSDVVNLKRKKAGAICGGRQACLVGSEYLAYGVKINDEAFPGFSSYYRKDFMRNRPGLRIAYAAINEAARRYALKGWREYVEEEFANTADQWDDPTTPDEGWGEWFFEDLCKYNSIPYDETRKHIIQIVRNAKRLIKSGVIS